MVKGLNWPWIALMCAGPLPAAAQTLNVTNSVQTYPTLTNTVAVPAEAQGRTCTISTENGQSVHTGASVTFVSASTVTLQGTEETPDALRSGSLTLGQTITATAVVGQDPAYPPGLGGFSLDAGVVDCPDVPTTTTIAPTTTTVGPQVGGEVVTVGGVVTVQPTFTG